MRRLVLVACVVLSLTALTFADEGMWLFNHPPTAVVEMKYGFTLTPTWLEHVQKSSVRFNSGGSGSFVSADGLTFTNHHIAQTCLHAISTAEKDLYKTGFSAKTQAEEAKCPDLELNVPMGMEDVTAHVTAGVTTKMTAAEAGTKQRANMSQLEADCNKSTGLRCEVVTFYSGAVYEMYRYKKYTDVRLVFAPEFDIAFFGGDPDNFEYPRFDLDVAFFRVYENDKPVRREHYLKWATTELKNNDLVFVSGHPGSTDRQATLNQLGFLRDASLPLALELGNRRASLLKAWGAKSEENYRRAQQVIFSLENNLKRNKMYLSSLFNQQIVEKRHAEEIALRNALDATSQNSLEDPWEDLATAMRFELNIYLPLLLVERRSGFVGDLAGYARALVRAAAERQKPNAQRLREYAEAALPSLQQSLFANTPVYKDMEELQLADSLALLQEKLPDDPTTIAVLKGRRPEEVAHELVTGTKLDNPAVRKQLYEGGQAAIAGSTDPMIVLMRTIDAEARVHRKQFDDRVASVERVAGSRIGRLRFERNSFNVPPDATFTLRLSFGAVKGYVEDGVGAGLTGNSVPPFTTMGGAFEHAAEKGNKEPFRLPKSWVDAKASGKINLNTPLNFVSTADIIGGNSGSPVINTSAEVVGIIFDGNMQSLPWRYAFDDVAGRAVSVDSRGILEALRNIYGASRVAEELMGSPSSATSR